MYGSNSTKGYQGRGFQPLSGQEVLVLGANGNRAGIQAPGAASISVKPSGAPAGDHGRTER